MNKKLLALIKEKFEKKISLKTGWGKNEIMLAYNNAVTEAVLEVLDEAN
jgi:hypothetical protein